uniref:Thioredoxin domain-containing protein n=1 Tax=Amphimedon queenslandica TaxID=400682 RepID=A0A1X7VIF4_AMPQE
MASSLFTGVSSLNSSKTDSIPVSSLDGEGKVVGLYFSAHWCPPCRGFTPRLAEWYTKLTSGALKDKLEIVFVSSDRDETSFNEYFSEMPWLALPYENRDKKTELSKKFKVSGIPTLVFVNGEDGKTITQDGRSVVTDDPDGKDFPWAPPTLEEILLSAKFINKDEKELNWSDVKKKTVGFYFSAHWCGPCKTFTPQLVKTFDKLKSDGKEFEIVFVSSDRSQEDMKGYFSTMPWHAVKFRDPAGKKLSKHFEVEGIPTLIIFDCETNKVISTNGRGRVSGDPDGHEFPWHRKPVVVLKEENTGDVNDHPHLIWFTGDTSPETAKEVLLPIATEYIKKNEGFYFMYTDKKEDEEGMQDSLASFINLPERRPLLIVIDISGQRKAIIEDAEITAETVKDTLKKYEDGSLSFVGIKA